MNANLPEPLPWGGLCVSLSGNNIITGDVGGTSLLSVRSGSLRADGAVSIEKGRVGRSVAAPSPCLRACGWARGTLSSPAAGSSSPAGWTVW